MEYTGSSHEGVASSFTVVKGSEVAWAAVLGEERWEVIGRAVSIEPPGFMNILFALSSTTIHFQTMLTLTRSMLGRLVSRTNVAYIAMPLVRPFKRCL
jgi:hypothetical protein